MPFKRHNPGCPCCEDVSSSSFSSSSPSSSLSSSSSASSIVFDPCDCEEDSTYYLKLEYSGFRSDYEHYDTSFSQCCLFAEADLSSFNGTYLIPLQRLCSPATFILPVNPNPGPVFFGADTYVLGVGYFRGRNNCTTWGDPMDVLLRVERAGLPLGTTVRLKSQMTRFASSFTTFSLDLDLEIRDICTNPALRPEGTASFLGTWQDAGCTGFRQEPTGMVKYSVVGGPTP